MTVTPPGALPVPIVPGLTDLQVFARGGYATVYRAVQISVGREVAVKVENRTLDSERDQARFLREARAAGRMSSHPHVVDLFDVGVTVDQHPYLIMELCDGSYAERMRTSPLGAIETRDLGVKIADALAHSHAAGVLHRDVKPANILHSHFNSAVLADFGLAVLAEVRDPTVTMEVLTPAYAPPEMFSHSPPSPAVDVYALCATLYAVMNGKPPRWQTERNPSLVTVLEMFNQPVPGLPGVPERMMDVLRAGMANDPAARPSAAELRGLLASLPLGSSGGAVAPVPRHSIPVGGIPTTSGAYLGGHTPVPPPGAGPGQDAAPAARRRIRHWLIGGLGALALAGAAGAGAWVASGTPGSEPTPTASASQTATPGGPTSPASGSGPLPGCLMPLPGAARCSAQLECFGPMLVVGRRTEAARLPCTGPHTWESYAESDLPADLVGAGHRVVKADPAVRQVCSETVFRLTSGLMNTKGWNLEVLPPTESAVAAGDRTFRCLAGRGTDQLTEPTLTGR